MSIGKRVRVFTDDSSNDMIVTTSSLDLYSAKSIKEIAQKERDGNENMKKMSEKSEFYE